MTKKEGLIFGGVALAGWLVFKAVDAYKRLRYKIDNFRFSSLDLNNGIVIVAFDFVLYNPTSVSVTVDSLVGDILLEGRKIGEVNTPVSRVLYAKETTVIPVQVVINSNVGIEHILNLLTYSTMQQWVASFFGTLSVAGHSLPVSYSYELKNIQL